MTVGGDWSLGDRVKVVYGWKGTVVGIERTGPVVQRVLVLPEDEPYGDGKPLLPHEIEFDTCP